MLQIQPRTVAVEVQRFFSQDELFSYDKGEYLHIYAEYERQ